MNKKERQIAFSAVLGFIDDQKALRRVTEALGIDYSVARLEVAQEYFQKLGVDYTWLNTSGSWKELLEKPEEEKVLDWSLVADGVAVRCADWREDQPSEIFVKSFHLNVAKAFDLDHKPSFQFDTKHWNAWRGGECPFGQPDAVVVEVESHTREVCTGLASSFDWRSRSVSGFRVRGLMRPWRYPE